MDSQKLVNFVNWFKEETGEVEIFERLEIKKFDGYGYGMACKEREKFKNNDFLLKIPNHVFLSYGNLKKKFPEFLEILGFSDEKRDELINKGIKVGPSENNINFPSKKIIEEALLTLFLIYCKKNKRKKHYWKSYTDLLVGLSTQGSLAEINSWDENKNLKHDCLCVFLVVKNFISNIKNKNYRSYFYSIEDEMENETKNIRDLLYVWAYSIISSRSSNTTDFLGGSLGDTFLVPLLDFFNHRKTNSFQIKYNENNYDAFLVYNKSEKDEKKTLFNTGEQIFIDYGEYQYLYPYGKLK